jgi:tubulysin polyketide synthase-like protein
MLMVLLTELVRLDVRLFAEAEHVRVQAQAGTLTEELRLAMTTHKAHILRFARCPYVETIDGLGRLTGHLQEQDLTFVSPERRDAWRYKVGVASLSDGIERFYWPRMVSLARPTDPQTHAHERLP